VNDTRRLFLKGAASAGVVSVAVGAGLLSPGRVLAMDWPQPAFDADNLDATLQELFGDAESTESADIKVKAPDIAENGAVVPITVETGLTSVESISIIAENNPAPLSASFVLASNAQGYVSTRIKMGKTSKVMAMVKADGKLYSASKEVKVTIGGCGG
jgi:sulfur-oxidizing protein SoxY